MVSLSLSRNHIVSTSPIIKTITNSLSVSCQQHVFWRAIAGNSHRQHNQRPARLFITTPRDFQTATPRGFTGPSPTCDLKPGGFLHGGRSGAVAGAARRLGLRGTPPSRRRRPTEAREGRRLRRPRNPYGGAHAAADFSGRNLGKVCRRSGGELFSKCGRGVH